MRVGWLFVFIGLIVAAAVLLVVFAANALKINGVFKAEIVLPLIVITGVVALLATLAATAATFGLFGISDKDQALGLPSGSIQAVIALSLILIFAVVALYASGDTGSEQFESTGLTAAQLQAIPPQQVVSAQRTQVEGEVVYDVVRSVEDPAAKDINTQLLTTVSTLVVAVAGFYFGSKSVREGGDVAIAAAGPTRSLILEKPASPAKTPPGVDLKDITLRSVPSGAQLRWAVEGDDTGSLVRLEDGTFVYRPGQALQHGESATLQFAQVDDPTASVALTVEIVDPRHKPKQEHKPKGHQARKAP